MPQNCFRSFLVQAVSYRWPFPTEGRFLWQAVSYAWPTTHCSRIYSASIFGFKDHTKVLPQKHGFDYEGLVGFF